MEILGDGHLVGYDDEAQKAVVEFTAREAFCHTNGTIVQGGFVTAWLDSAMTHAVKRNLGEERIVATLEIKVTFLQAAGPGSVRAEGWVRRLGSSIAFVEGQLLNDAGELLATASSTAKLVKPRS